MTWQTDYSESRSKVVWLETHKKKNANFTIYLAEIDENSGEEQIKMYKQGFKYELYLPSTTSMFFNQVKLKSLLLNLKDSHEYLKEHGDNFYFVELHEVLNILDLIKITVDDIAKDLQLSI